MKLLLVFTAILAISLAEEEKKNVEILDDSEAEASAAVELLKEGADLNTAESSYNTYVPPSQRLSQWNAPNYVKPSVPQNTWFPPKEETKPIQPINTQVPSNVQNDYYDHHHHHHHHNNYPQWSTPNYHPPTTTTPVSVIKNEQFFGDNGYYKYEYQIADGTHVGEEGYYTDSKQTEESLVKKGWYSYRGADGKTYTVTYWADKSGYHPSGAHLPTPPPVPAANQEALDKEKENDKYKPQYDYPTQTPAPVYYPTQAPIYKPQNDYPTQTSAPVYYPTQAPDYQPQQPNYVPQQPSYVSQQTYQPPQTPVNDIPQASDVPQQTYNPPQQTYYPPQHSYNPPQQTYYPPQQSYYPQQSNTNYV